MVPTGKEYRNSPLIVNIILLRCSLLTIFAFLELSFRVKAYLDDRQNFSKALSKPVPIPEGKDASLGHIIKPTSNLRLIYEMKPNLRVKFMGEELRTNSQGFRDTEHQTIKPAGTLRVVGIGDSVMFGWRVPQEEDYLSLLEERLNNLLPNMRVETINTAVPGYNTANEVEMLKEKGLSYSPDIVILGVVGNDESLPDFIQKDEDYLSFK